VCICGYPQTVLSHGQGLMILFELICCHWFSSDLLCFVFQDRGNQC